MEGAMLWSQKKEKKRKENQTIGEAQQMDVITDVKAAPGHWSHPALATSHQRCQALVCSCSV